MTKEFCPTGPQGCGLVKEDNPVCEKSCWHKDDIKFKNPYQRWVFGQLVWIVGMNGDDLYLEDGSTVDKSQALRNKPE